MKKTTALLGSVLALLLIASVCTGCAFFSAGTTYPVPVSRSDSGLSVMAESFGADGSDGEDDRHCIQLALNFARDRATAALPVTVTLGDGVYYIEKGLTVFSHTRFILSDRAVIVYNGLDGSMLYGGSGSGTGYGTLNDAVISGGVWRGNAAATGGRTQLFAIKRTSGIKLKSLIMEDSSDHFVMLTGVKDAVVTDCTFRDYVSIDSVDQFTKEALHIDFLPLGGNDYFPSKNITVDHCHFENVASGIGTHHYGYGNYETDIAVRGCSFTGVLYNCINAYSMAGLEVSECNAGSCGAFLWCRSTDCRIFSNDISRTGERCISVLDGSAAVISRNHISNVCGESASGKSIALLSSDSSCVMEENEITHVDGTGIRLKGGGSMSTVKGNTVSHVSSQGIFISDARVSVEGNHVSDCLGIWTEASDCRIADNTVEDSQFGVAVHCCTATVTGNTVISPRERGIRVTATEELGSSAVVEKNTVTGAGTADVSIGRNCTGCIVRENNCSRGFRLTCSPLSDAVAFRNGQNPPPAAPWVNCSVSGDNARLSWQKAEGAADYIVYRYDTEADSLIRMGETKGLHYDIEGLFPEASNTFLVVSRSSDGMQSFYTYPANLVDAGTGISAAGAEVLYSRGDSSVRTGQEACFYARASGSGLRFCWQFRKKGASQWSNWKGKTSSFITAKAEASWDGMQVRCEVTDSSGKTVYSQPIEVKLIKGAEITMQSEDVYVRKDGTVLLGVAVNGDECGFHWYFRKAGSSKWEQWNSDGSDSPNVSAIAGELWDGAQARCLVTCGNGEKLFSKPIDISVGSPLRIVSEPADVFAEDGETVQFEIKADGKGTLGYQWYYRKAGDEVWNLWWGHDSSSFSVAANSTWQGMQVKCAVTDESGAELESRIVSVTITE